MADAAKKDADGHKTDIEKLKIELAEAGQKDDGAHKQEIDALNKELTEAGQKDTEDDGIDYDVVIKEQKQVESAVKDSISDMRQKLYTADWPGKISDANKRMGSLMGEQLNVEKHIPVLENEVEHLIKMDKDVRCDKCGNMITAASVQGFIKEKGDKIAEYKKMSQDYDDLIDKVRAEIEGYRKAGEDAGAEIPLFEKKLDKVGEGIKQLYDKKHAQTERAFERNQAITRIKNRIEAAEASWKSQKDMAVSRIQNLIDSTQKMHDKAVELQKDYLTRSEREAHEEGRLHSERIEKDKQAKELAWRVEHNTKGIEALDFWKVAFSAKGIRSVLLDRFCNEFNGIANDYLATASKGMMSIIVSPLAKLKSDEERNKIEIHVFIGEDDVRYESLSGGEKRRVDIALCMALNKWVSNKYQIPNGLLGLMILDEMFSFVDRMGEESIATLLYEEGQTKSILVISHTPELESYATRVYHVTKENGVSHLDTEKVVPRRRNEKPA
jgi:DNA repair exonuclease SbcCD ATPase subunit